MSALRIDGQVNLQKFRLTLFSAAALYVLAWPIFHYSVPEAVDPLWERIVLAAICGGVVGATYFWKKLTDYLFYINIALAWSITLHFFSLVYRNDFVTAYSLCFFVTFLTVAANFFSKRSLVPHLL